MDATNTINTHPPLPVGAVWHDDTHQDTGGDEYRLIGVDRDVTNGDHTIAMVRAAAVQFVGTGTVDATGAIMRPGITVDGCGIGQRGLTAWQARELADALQAAADDLDRWCGDEQ